MFGTNSYHGGRDGYLYPIASTTEDLTYSFNSEASQHERGNRSHAEHSNKRKNADKYLESISKIGTSNPSKNNVGKDDNQLGLIYRHIYSTVNNALNLSSTQDEELTYPSNRVWDDLKAQDSKQTVKRRGRVNSTEVQRVDTIENLSRIYKSRRKTEIDDNSIFFTSIMRELRKQNKDNLTSVIEKKLADQARGFNMNMTCVGPSRHRTSSVKTRSRKDSMSKESSILVNGKPFTRNEGRTSSIKATSNENSGKNLQRARPHSEGKCFFPDDFALGKSNNAIVTKENGSASRKERFNSQRKNSKNSCKTEVLKLPKEYNSLEPPEVSKRDIELNRSPSLRGLNTEEDQSPIILGDKRPKFSDTVSKNIKEKLNQTYAWPPHQFNSPNYFAKHERTGPSIPKSKTSSPLKIDMSFDRQKQQEYLREEKEKVRREKIQRSHEYKKLTKSRIMTDFERISKKLKAYQEMREKNDKHMETMKKY